ncbi:serine/threonine protein kinase [Falsihalocynthiibacter arcticus]|uniref:Serine/threonine protein kinase n=1 Tax=Falsihalocynthiibacter arcticus TaxID=1579316 RepID=A0A126UXA8_9RHOB|nr:serine/threonine protein kinase [Falsihalocynthiibacter arcticus]AML50703.1 serine/threonine protein kinase [Falsihalocynthiibacter arcticus]
MNSNSNRGIFQIGDVLNNTYRIEKVLGRGGTSEVYLATSVISGRVMALKALRPEYSLDEDFRALMTREEDMREIRHDAIVRYYDNQQTDSGLIYLVMDYVEGPGLDRKIKDGGMPADELLILCKRVTEGLVAAHKKNIVHRDLSPDNIILRDGNPHDAVIIDFGIAKDTNPGAETVVGNEFAGKYAYAAPEQLSGQTDARADIYSLGALLLATYRGKAPDIGNNPMEVIKRKSEVLDTSGVPEPLKSLLDAMTRPDREFRLQSAQAVLDRLQNPQDSTSEIPTDLEDMDRTVIAPLSKAKPKTTPSASPKTTENKSTRQDPQPPKKSRSLLIPTLAVLLVLAGGAGGYFSGLFGGLVTTSYPVADPFTFVASRSENGTAQAVGNVPSEDIQLELTQLITKLGGSAELTLASGEIAETWGKDVLQLVNNVSGLPEWRVLLNANQVRITGLTNDASEQQRLNDLFAGNGIPAGLTGTANIELGPRILPVAALLPALNGYADCGELQVINPPAIGYSNADVISVTGRVASDTTQGNLAETLAAIIGERSLDLDFEVLNPTLCSISGALPMVPTGGVGVTFGLGPDNTPNPTGTFFVGDNPIIDITLPADLTDGYLFVSALDVSGSVFHLLPNVLIKDNSIASLRDGRSGPIDIRVAYSLDDAADGSKLAFNVDATSLGKTQIIAIYSDTQIFDGIRPTTESAGGYAAALKARSGTIRSLDSRILTTAERP